MSWTDERVETLKRMWLDGKSASQIAAELSNGITRNAVIGKVHRLGFAGRAKTPNMPAPRARPPKMEGSGNRALGKGSGGGGPISHGATALAYSPQTDMAPDLRPIEDVVIPISARVTILELRDAMCKWPLGDPTTPEFRYCGSPSPLGAPYCGPHARVAYQPAQDRRRDRRPPPRR